MEKDIMTFPSPIGELHFSIKENGFLDYGTLFPSPIGELHFSIMYHLKLLRRNYTVSVPYRGATFLNTIPATPCSVWDR